jgi:hypothetical protein
VIAVRREDDVPAAVGEHAHGGAERPRREHQVVRLHHLAGALSGRHHHHGHLADPEQHDGPVAARQVPHGTVRELTRDVEQAADEGQLPRARWQPKPMGGAALALREHDEQRRES